MSTDAPRSENARRILDELNRSDAGDRPHAVGFAEFVNLALERVRGPYFSQRPPKEAMDSLSAAFAVLCDHRPDTVSVELAEGRSNGVRVCTVMDDQPFIVDTIRVYLRTYGAEYWGGFHLVVEVTRDDNGKVTAIGEGQRESVVWVEAEAGSMLENPESRISGLRERLLLSRQTVRDFRPMTRAVERAIERCEVEADRTPDRAPGLREGAAFLQWLLRENFVFMGMSHGDNNLGIQSMDSRFHSDASGDWPPAHDDHIIQVRKSSVESPIHRSGRVDEILVTLGDDTMFLRGMFTYRAVTQASRNVPILRRVLAEILRIQEATPGSYRYKGIANVFDSLPTEFLFTASVANIGEMVDLIFEAEQSQEVSVTLQMTSSDTAFCLVAMPKPGFSDDIRQDVEDQLMAGLNATYTDHGVFVGRYDIVLLHFFLTGVTGPSDASLQDLTDSIRGLVTPWAGRLWAALAAAEGEDTADRLLEKYGRAFDDSWTREVTPADTVRDILHLEELSGDRPVVVDVHADGDEPMLRLYQKDNLFLTRSMPVLDNFGIRVIRSAATYVNASTGTISFDSFWVQGDRHDFEASAANLEEALPVVFGRLVDNDSLNALVLTAGLSWQQVDALRGYLRYMLQMSLHMNLADMQRVVLAGPEICKALSQLFDAKFNPEVKRRKSAIKKAHAAVDDLLRGVHRHDQHLIFSTMLELIDATLRTNFYRTDRVTHYISYKFNSQEIGALPGEKPMYEIFVHSRVLEGVHLRFGPVARGGLRWSDRTDFRTEILGLATTQQAKNVVIVPEGSKGGFYLKYPAADRAERRAQADECYKIFIRGLLDLTDNVVGDDVVHPPNVVIHDGEDPYLVVAADKGTAHLSDTANGLSQEYGFWLADAFASGGSNGYDHKAVGITARGAWVLVRRHFHELGHDPDTQEFTAVGVGDMGGDVFGNGLIESPKTRLLGAFNHLHIFLDPNPDAEASWKERVRLFKAGRGGGWENYNKDLISEGGGVFERSASSIPLSPQVQEMLGLAVEEAAPEEIMRAILRMKVDLIWNGGIGTYFKSSTESNADVGDTANDGARVSANEIRARIVGEGANLAFTQKARIEASLAGVRMNTDAIDNSGGVDMSDHEVNLKLLLGRVVERGEMTMEQRNELIEELTEEEAALVLANNDMHGRQLSRDQLRSRRDVFPFERAIAFVCKEFNRTRKQLNLPTADTLAVRAAEGEGLTRPELAVLSAYVKMFVFRGLMAGDPKSVRGYSRFLTTYFPVAIQERYPDDVRNHRLADEIAMTCATTRFIADTGVTLVPMAIETTGASVPEVVDAYFRAQLLGRASAVRAELREQRGITSLPTLYDAWIGVDSGCRQVANYWLSARGRTPTDDQVEQMAEAVDQVYELQSGEDAARADAAIAELRDKGVPEQVAALVLKASYLNVTLAVWANAQRLGVSFRDAVVRQFAVARASGIQQVIDSLENRRTVGAHESIALRILANRFIRLLRNLVINTPIEDTSMTVDQLTPVLRDGVLAPVADQIQGVLTAEGDPSVATLLVLEERVGAAVGRLGA